MTDHMMPHMTGVEFAREVIMIRPDIPIILCTGFNDSITVDAARAAGIQAFLMKPATRQEIAEAIRQALDKQAFSDCYPLLQLENPSGVSSYIALRCSGVISMASIMSTIRPSRPDVSLGPKGMSLPKKTFLSPKKLRPHVATFFAPNIAVSA